MRKFAASFGLFSAIVLVSLSSPLSAAHSQSAPAGSNIAAVRVLSAVAPKPGAVCKSKNQLTMYRSVIFKCSPVKKKLVWVKIGTVKPVTNPTPKATPTATPAPTTKPSPQPTPTAPSPSQSPTATPSPAPAPAPAPAPVSAPSPTATTSPTPTPQPTPTPTPKQAQTISFSPMPEVRAQRNSILTPVAASASSGLALSITASPADVCVGGETHISVKSAGTCTVTFTQDGDANFEPAPRVSTSFNVLPAFTKVETFKGQGSVTCPAGWFFYSFGTVVVPVREVYLTGSTSYRTVTSGPIPNGWTATGEALRIHRSIFDGAYLWSETLPYTPLIYIDCSSV